MFGRIVKRPVGQDASATAVIENGCRFAVVDARGGYPVAFDLKHVVELVDGGHFVAVG